ncbi:hypothetical protein JX265_011614 [Neoarthrinium moseri]|uniref:Uncharacterized protein n=1 Tax=Neoarthrinium moseri TaxID=1658444 RepID=A0A9P9WC64_9PEZI|nr:hypothetical protein JX265_011614 [Neoarthrinium moseri]
MGSVKRARSVPPPDERARELRLRRRVDECDQSLERKLDSFICHEDCIPEQTVLDVDGDLIIIVGTIACQRLDNAAYHHSLSAAAFRVRSSTVTGNSAVLKDIIHQNMKRLNTTGAEWIAQFPEDKVDPWSAALHIMHGQFDKAPELKCHLLVGVFHLTALCRKYDLLHLLRPWATQISRINPTCTTGISRKSSGVLGIHGVSRKLTPNFPCLSRMIQASLGLSATPINFVRIVLPDLVFSITCEWHRMSRKISLSDGRRVQQVASWVAPSIAFGLWPVAGSGPENR